MMTWRHKKEIKFCYRTEFKKEMTRDDAGEIGRDQITGTLTDVIFRALEAMLL